MAQSGIFNLVLRDERFDKHFTASDYLRERLAGVYRARAAAGKKNPLPTFADLEKTHILYLRAVYRPHASVASEYVRVKPSGDAGTLSASGGTAEFSFPIYGHFTGDMVFHVRFKDIGTAAPTVIPELDMVPQGQARSPRYRFCAYPGIRLFRKVGFRSDETLIDDYVSDEVSFANKFTVGSDRRRAWDRGMGQAEVRTAEAYNPAGHTAVYSYRDGLQTPKYLHKTQDLWVPAQFWMCGDASNALLNDLIPNSQRTVVCDLAPLADIVQAVDQLTGLPIPLPFDRVGLQIDLYVNNIFVNPEVHELYASRVGFSLIRVHRRQMKMMNTSTASILLDQLKYPAEYLYVGFRDRENLKDFDHWHLHGRAPARPPGSEVLVALTYRDIVANVNPVVITDTKDVGTLEPIAESFKLTAHGIDLFPSMPASFYNTYLPQRYFAGTAVVAPQDTSAFLATFCLYPGKHNPSGYYNLSAGRELYLSYQASTVDHENTAEAVVSMSALNFLVRKGDKAFLRYAL